MTLSITLDSIHYVFVVVFFSFFIIKTNQTLEIIRIISSTGGVLAFVSLSYAVFVSTLGLLELELAVLQDGRDFFFFFFSAGSVDFTWIYKQT